MEGKHAGQPKDTATPYAPRHVRYLDVLTPRQESQQDRRPAPDPEGWLYE